MPAILTTHPQGERAQRAINGRLAAGESIVLAAHSLLETYATLTSFPQHPRLSGANAASLIEAFADRAAAVVTLDHGDYVALLRSLAARAVVGGTSYDGLIYECARRAQVHTLLTFNERHFARLGSEVGVVVPEP